MMYSQFLKYIFQLSVISILISGCKKTPDEDTTAPVLTLYGDAVMTIERGTTFTEPGATATDETDGGIAVQFPSAPNTSAAGVYILSYNATDKAGNKSIKERTVNVSYPASQMALTYNVTDSATVSGSDTVLIYQMTAVEETSFSLFLNNLFNDTTTVIGSIVGNTLSIPKQNWKSGTAKQVSGSGTITLSGSEFTINLFYSIADTVALTTTTCKATCVSQ